MIEQLRLARVARGEDLPQLAARAGVRQQWLAAIDEGRLTDLPRGIYGRAAIRGYAAAVGVDPQAALAACAPFLQPIEDPIASIAQLRGIRRPKPPRRVPAAQEAPPPARESLQIHATGPRVDGRALAAAAVDASIVVTMMMVIVAITAAFCRVPASAFGRGSAPAFAVMGMLLAASYFLGVGGVAGVTCGEMLLQRDVSGLAPESRRIDLWTIWRRGVRCAWRDADSVRSAGAGLADLAFRRRRSMLPPSHGDATA